MKVKIDYKYMEFIDEDELRNFLIEDYKKNGLYNDDRVDKIMKNNLDNILKEAKRTRKYDTYDRKLEISKEIINKRKEKNIDDIDKKTDDFFKKLK